MWFWATKPTPVNFWILLSGCRNSLFRSSEPTKWFSIMRAWQKNAIIAMNFMIIVFIGVLVYVKVTHTQTSIFQIVLQLNFEPDSPCRKVWFLQIRLLTFFDGLLVRRCRTSFHVGIRHKAASFGVFVDSSSHRIPPFRKIFSEPKFAFYWRRWYIKSDQLVNYHPESTNIRIRWLTQGRVCFHCCNNEKNSLFFRLIPIVKFFP